MDVIFSYYLRNTRNCLPTELLYWVWLGCSQLSSQQPISCSILDFWLKEYRQYTIVLAAAGHCLHSIIFFFFFLFLTSPASTIKRLRNCEDIARIANPHWSKGYSVPYNIMFSNKNWWRRRWSRQLYSRLWVRYCLGIGLLLGSGEWIPQHYICFSPFLLLLNYLCLDS